jgi:hypothetical protein
MIIKANICSIFTIIKYNWYSDCTYVTDEEIEEQKVKQLPNVPPLLSGGLLEPAMGPCLCELVPGLVRKLQGTGAKVSDQTLPV